MKLSLSLLTLFTLLFASACTGEETPESLFDPARTDVVPLDGDGVQIGLVNTTHNIVWDYAHGYSRFGADHQVIWGPLASVPANELAQCEEQDSADHGASSQRSGTVCVCAGWSYDGRCYWLECASY